MHTAPTLTVDLSAIQQNWRLLKERFTGPECAAVVKANAYGLGVEPVASALAAAGCRTFFVATLEEGIELVSSLRAQRSNPHSESPRASNDALTMTKILVFHGPYAGEEKDYAAHALIPVLNSMEQVKRWTNTAPFALHVDTGMNRLGLTQNELSSCPLPAANCRLLMSHLAVANEPDHPLNAEQLSRFRQACALLPGVPASLCNSSGIFLGKDFHFDLARPGCALYGINPTREQNPMQPVATLSAPIIQVRTLDRDGTVGYGATYDLKKGSRVAIVQLGYADGYLRGLSNRAEAAIADRRVPVVGRVSMDMIAVDVSGVPETHLNAAGRVELMNADITVDAIADAAGTIGYEVLTRLGQRVERMYKP